MTCNYLKKKNGFFKYFFPNNAQNLKIIFRNNYKFKLKKLYLPVTFINKLFKSLERQKYEAELS